MLHNSNPIDNLDSETVMDWLVKSIKSVQSGRIAIDMQNEPAMEIYATANRIDVDILNPEFLNLPKATEDNEDKREGRIEKLKDKLNIAKEFAEELTDSETELLDKLEIPKFANKLTDNDTTIVFSRKGKEAIILGKEAKPTFSKLVSRSDDIQIKSLREVRKLVSDLKPED
jgi:hypothetical protein